MDSDHLLNGIKSVLTGLGAKTSNTTNGGVMLVNTQTGEPNGMMTMANLASVLGVAKSLPDNTSLDDCYLPGMYYFAALQSSIPQYDTGSRWCKVLNIGSESGEVLQIMFNMGVGKLFYRNRTSTGSWLAWAEFATV